MTAVALVLTAPLVSAGSLGGLMSPVEKSPYIVQLNTDAVGGRLVGEVTRQVLTLIGADAPFHEYSRVFSGFPVLRSR